MVIYKATLTRSVTEQDLQLHIPRKIVAKLKLKKADEMNIFVNDNCLIIGKDLPGFLKFMNWCMKDINDKTER